MTLDTLERSYRENNTIGKRIKEARERRCMTQAELAEKSEIDPVTISRCERGVNIPTTFNLIKLALALRHTIDGLVDTPFYEILEINS